MVAFPPQAPTRRVQDMFFYQLPEHAHYYSELVNGLGAGGDAAIAADHATVRPHGCFQ